MCIATVASEKTKSADSSERCSASNSISGKDGPQDACCTEVPGHFCLAGVERDRHCDWERRRSNPAKGAALPIALRAAAPWDGDCNFRRTGRPVWQRSQKRSAQRSLAIEVARVPHISVILANYNGATYLAEAIDSVLAQDYDDFELVIVDDASTDESLSIIHGFATRAPDKIRKIVHDRNKGQAEGFNTGVRSAAGDIVCFLDSDDLWYPNKIFGVAAYFSLAPNCVMFQHNLYFRRGDVPTKLRFRDFSAAGDILKYSQSLGGGRFPQFIPTSGLSIKTSVLRELMPIPPHFRTCADGYITRTAMTLGSVGFLDECWGEYRVHGSNNTYHNKSFDQRLYIYKQLAPTLNSFYAARGLPFRFPESALQHWLRRRQENMHAFLGMTGMYNSLQRGYEKLTGKKSLISLRNTEEIRRYRSAHSGKRGFILGMGPSLKVSDLERLKGEVTFACNKIFLAFPQTKWRPTYYSVLDVLVAKNNAPAISNLNLVKFFGESCRKYFDEADGLWLNELASPIDEEGRRIYSFSEDASVGVYGGFTVIYLQLQLAWHMGIKEVFLIGLDFHFDYGAEHRSGQICKHGEILVSRGEVNHFHPEYRKKGEGWTVPQLEKQRRAFLKAKQFFDANGGRIYNASRCTKLDVFERVNFDDVIADVRGT